MTRKISNRRLDNPTYKITGEVRDGRWDSDSQDWLLMRITPRYFHTLGHAQDFFNSNNIHRGTMWKLVASMSTQEYKYRSQKWKPKGAYGIIRKKGLRWGIGGRAKGNNKYTPRDELARADPNNFRHGNKYPSSKYNQWQKDGARKEKESKKK